MYYLLSAGESQEVFLKFFYCLPLLGASCTTPTEVSGLVRSRLTSSERVGLLPTTREIIGFDLLLHGPIISYSSIKVKSLFLFLM